MITNPERLKSKMINRHSDCPYLQVFLDKKKKQCVFLMYANPTQHNERVHLNTFNALLRHHYVLQETSKDTFHLTNEFLKHMGVLI